MLNKFIAGINVDTGIFVGKWFIGHLWGGKIYEGDIIVPGTPFLYHLDRNRKTSLVNTRRSGLTKRSLYAQLCAITALFLVSTWIPSVDAAEVPTLFTAEVPYDESNDDAREEAYETALIEILTRVSTSVLSGDAEAVRRLFPNPEAYVTQLRPGKDDTLWVSFDGQAIEKVLRDDGQVVWGQDRPLTLVWLGVDWGRGRREIIAADDPDDTESSARSIDRNQLLRERVLDIAEKRGLPLAFPLLDTTDLQRVSFSDIWGGFNSRIADASKRYDVNSILIGRISPSSNQRNRWTYLFAGEEREWSGPPETVIGQIADLIAAEYSFGGNAPLQSFALNISGIESIDAYGSVQHVLDGLALIENFKISEVEGDTVSYDIEVRGSASRLRRALRVAGLIESETVGGTGDLGLMPDLEFFYSP